MKSLPRDDPDYNGACRRLRARVVDVWATVILPLLRSSELLPATYTMWITQCRIRQRLWTGLCTARMMSELLRGAVQGRLDDEVGLTC